MPFRPESAPLGKSVLDREHAPVQTMNLEDIVAENIRLDRIARARLRILDSTSEGIYQIDAEGRCVFMNRAACFMLGYGFGEALGKRMHELHHGKAYDPASSEKTCPIHGSGSCSSGIEPAEDVFRGTNGVSFPVECCSYPVFGRGGQSEGQQGNVITFRDITERKKMERRIMAQHAVSRALEATTSIEDLIPLLIRTLGESLGFCWGALWQLDEGANRLRLSDSWCSCPSSFGDFEEICSRSAFEMGEDLPGRVWESGEPIWISDVDSGCSPHVAAVACTGFKCGFAMPVRMTTGLFGVLEFLSWETSSFDPELFGVLRLVGSTIGQVLERKRSEDVRTRLAAILDAGTDFVGVVLDPSGKLVSVSHAVEPIFGFRATELIGQPLELIIPDYRQSLSASGWDKELHPPEGRGRTVRMSGKRRSGKKLQLDVSLGECLESGSRVIAGIIQDISERVAVQQMLDRQAEDLRRSEETLRYQTRLINSIVTSMADGLIAIDEKGEVVLYNPAAADLTGERVGQAMVIREKLSDTRCTSYLPDKRTPVEWDDLPLLRAVRGEVVDNAETFMKSPSRPEGFWMNGAARPMIDNDGVLRGAVLVFRDVSDQKAAREALHAAKEEAEAANGAKSEFLSRMSHELRTPMNAILGFAQLLDSEELSPEYRDPIARILRAARHLLSLINEVLDISRIEAGRLKLQMDPLQPYEVLQSAFELMAPLAAKREIYMSPLCSADTHWTVNADRKSLTQVYVNLLGNAVKYNRVGGSVRVSFEEIGGNQLRVKIADTGQGLAKEQLKKLFVPFERLGAERSGIEGTGLGLAYSDRLVNAMGGSIGVESEPGNGSTFWVDMPLSSPKDAPSGFKPAGIPAITGIDMGVTQVLCIQDDPVSLGAIEEVFERLPGYAVVSATTGSTGIQIAQGHIPEMVLLDLDLPDMSGMDVLKALRSAIGGRQTPVIVISDNFTDEIKQKARDAGAHSCVAKPLKVRELVDTVVCLM